MRRLIPLLIVTAISCMSFGMASAESLYFDENGTDIIQTNTTLARIAKSRGPCAFERNPSAPAAFLEQIVPDCTLALSNPNMPVWVLEETIENLSGTKKDRFYDPKTAAIASNPNTPASVLRTIWGWYPIDMTRDESKDILDISATLHGITLNPNTPADILAQIFGFDREYGHDGFEECWFFCAALYNTSLVISNPNAPEALLARTNLAAHGPNASSERLSELAESNEYDIRMAVARHTGSPADALRHLSADPAEEVRILVAGNISTPKQTLRNLARDESWWVRAQVAGNPNTPIRTLYELSLNPDDKILRGTGHRHWDNTLLYGLCGNPRTPRFIIKKLMEDSDNLYALARNPSLTDDQYTTIFASSILNEPTNLVEYDSERWAFISVRIALAENPNVPESVLNTLSTDTSWQVRWPVAENRNISADIASRLSRDSENTVVAALEENPAIFSY